MGQQYEIDSLAIAPRRIFDDPGVSFHLLYNHKINNKIYVEAGLKYYTIFNTYYVGQFHPDFGYIKKVGFVKATTFNIPVNFEYHFKNKIYLVAGLSSSIAILKKRKDFHFNDTPAVDRLYNEAKHMFKPAFLNYGLGVGYRIWRIDVSYLYSNSITEITDPLNYDGNAYLVFQGLEIHHFVLSYFFQIKK